MRVIRLAVLCLALANTVFTMLNFTAGGGRLLNEAVGCINATVALSCFALYLLLKAVER